MPLSSHLPDLLALSLLIGVARTGSIGAAARVQGMSQQGASERLLAMERQVGVPLLQRGPRGSTLTAAGTVVVEWAARLIDAAEEMDAAIATLRTGRDRSLHIMASMTIAEHLLPRWLVLLRQRQSGQGAPTSVSLTASNSREVLAAVLDGTADLGFIEGPVAPTRLGVLDLADDELVLVTAPGDPLAVRRRGLSPAQVAALALTSREQGSGTREIVDRALAEHGLVQAEPAVEFTTSTGVREAVRAGSAPAFLSRRTITHDLQSGALVIVPTTGLRLGRTFRAVWSGGPDPPAGPVRDLLAIANSVD